MFMKHTKRLLMVALIGLVSAVTVFAGEKSGSVLIKDALTDKKGKTEVWVYLDSTGDGVTDTTLNFEIPVKLKEDSICLAELNGLIKLGSHVTFDDRYVQRPFIPRPGLFDKISWHDLIKVDDVSMAQRFPNPYWFPSALGIR
jgi:hypothetical protein